MKWITRERPTIDRIACPWLVARFIDETPESLCVPGGDVMRLVPETGAIPYDVPGVELGHHGERCSFDVFIAKYALRNPALDKLVLIVRAADCGAPQLAREAAGLPAISKGLSLNFGDDHEMLKHGMVIHDLPPVLNLQSADSFELANIRCNHHQPPRQSCASYQDIVSTDWLTLGLERRTNCRGGLRISFIERQRGDGRKKCVQYRCQLLCALGVERQAVINLHSRKRRYAYQIRRCGFDARQDVGLAFDEIRDRAGVE